MSNEGVTGPRSGVADTYQSPASPISGAQPADFTKKLLNDGWKKHLQAKAEQKQIAVVMEVPSGEKVAAVRMPLSYMLKAGIIPDRLSEAVEHQIALITAGDPKKSQQTVLEDYAKDAQKSEQEWKDVLDFIWTSCVVLPKFVADAEATPDDEDNPTFPISSVDLIDKLFLYEWCQGVNETVQAFRESTAEALGIMANEHSFSLTAEQFLRPDEPGGFLAGLPD